MHFDSALTALPRFLAGTVSGVIVSGFTAIMLGAPWVRRKGKAFAEHREPRGLGKWVRRESAGGCRRVLNFAIDKRKTNLIDSGSSHSTNLIAFSLGKALGATFYPTPIKNRHLFRNCRLFKLLIGCGGKI
jgi:hypothetical protein